jgi:hypothetical protein
MTALRVARVACVFALAACGPPPRAPAEAHTGWTLTYSHRVGVGLGAARDVRPDFALQVLDGRVWLRIPERAVDLRYDGSVNRAWQCAGRCMVVEASRAFAAELGMGDDRGGPGTREEPPDVETLTDPATIVSLPTRGARFVSRFRSPLGAFEVTLEVRWIDQPGERSVEAVQDVFLAPVRRWGLAQLVEELRRTAGLPLAWEMRVRAAGSAEVAVTVFRAASLDNPPAALSMPR